jgi:ABC-type multidrug transport system fused ATPase/permease subunit
MMKSIFRVTIAHRLHTVIDSDRILVLENGRVRQFAPPTELIQEEEGLFSHKDFKTTDTVQTISGL